MRSPALPHRFFVNGRDVEAIAPPAMRLSEVLRDVLGLKGTKVGCDAGDCGACTVLVDGAQVCACLVPVAQVVGRAVETVEGLARDGRLHALQAAFLRHGAAQCGICTPGMLMAAADLLRRVPSPSEAEVLDALGGVLCRCTGYRKIVAAVLEAARGGAEAEPLVGGGVGARLARVDGVAKVTGEDRFGADWLPERAWLTLRAVRSPYPHARFRFGDLDAFRRRHPGLVAILTAADVPGANRFGIYPTGKDQPVFAEGYVRMLGEPVCALVGDAETIAAIRDEEVPIAWEPLPPVSFDDALAGSTPDLHPHAPANVLCRGRIACGDVDAALATAPHRAAVAIETGFVEHAYIEPEAGYAERIGDGIEIVACTQTPYMDRDEIALILGIPPERVRIVPTAVGGGFGGKLDLSLQPMIAIAAWRTGRPVRCVYTRPESMRTTTKRHPARIVAEAGCDEEGRLLAVRFHGDFNTGAYASWGPTVASRVPVHAMGPYRIPNVRATTAAIHTTDTPAGAFRGFGVPQAAIAHEALMDALADRLGMDRLEFRLRNALRRGDATATGQVLDHSVGLVACLEALRPRWQALRAEADAFNRSSSGPFRRGVGIACMWYGIGNTAMSNPSEMTIGLAADGTITLYSGAVDIGQGSNTVMVQISAEALGVAPHAIRLVAGDTARTRDAGKTSASRQTFVSGNAARLAALDLRRQILALANAGPDARIVPVPGGVEIHDGDRTLRPDLSRLERDANGDVLVGFGRFDPPTTALDADGRGVPYATYAFGAQIALVEVDRELGTTRVLRMVAAHDVGRAINPTLVEGQIHGGIAQGIGLALMEEYLPGRNDNLHDYLIPTIGDVPPIEVILIEDAEPLGPFGAKGVGEPALIATAPAILGAIDHATGVRVTRVPATPDRLRAAILATR
ncbi:molybdopterin-dependent oxidoreductase [Elioraea thermophila]|uniref:molybdopterin-dependent oxidoreductase n=1 Tax=Elioraea thermophila TaxID=2185104 RepID=UPI000DF1B9FA|nr:molybdopterin cofactor-binding domain-containing protein [Elioraea thermophila]